MAFDEAPPPPPPPTKIDKILAALPPEESAVARAWVDSAIAAETVVARFAKEGYQISETGVYRWRRLNKKPEAGA